MVDIAAYRIQPLPEPQVRSSLDAVVITRRWTGVATAAASGDSTPPEITNPNPSPGAIAPSASISLDFTDDGDIAQILVYVIPTSGAAELVYDSADTGTPFQAPYTGSTSEIANGVRVQWARTGGYVTASIAVRAVVVDGGGNRNAGEWSYTPSPDPTPAPPDVTAPITSNVQPTPGTPISSTTPVSVDVTDDQGAFRRVLVAVELDGLTELAWDGDAWLGHYAGGGSERTPISGGFRFTVLRDGGWPSSPTLRVFAIDLSGNEA